MSLSDAPQALPHEVVELLNETDPAARAARWSTLCKTHATALEGRLRTALVKAWIDESTDADGELIGRLLCCDGPPPALLWLIPDYPTALECLSDLRAETPEQAATLVRTVLRLTQPAAAFFYTGARVSGYPMAVLKKIAEQRKVAFGVDVQRAADDLNIYVPVHLRIQRVEEMKLPWERFGLQPPAPESPYGEKSSQQSQSTPANTSHSAVPLSAATRSGTKPPPPTDKPLEFCASLMEAPSTEEMLEMANLADMSELTEMLWEKTNWKALLAECPSADVQVDTVLDEVPGYSDIYYKITILDRASFAAELRAAILNAVQSGQ